MYLNSAFQRNVLTYTCIYLCFCCCYCNGYSEYKTYYTTSDSDGSLVDYSFQCHKGVMSGPSCGLKCAYTGDLCVGFSFDEPSFECVIYFRTVIDNSTTTPLTESSPYFQMVAQVPWKALPNISEEWHQTMECFPLYLEGMYSDCFEIFELGGIRESGVYPIRLSNATWIDVYCDMVTDGGGWTVFQRRQDGSVDFYRDWNSYANGFGNMFGEFWLGNHVISLLTLTRNNELRIDMEDFENVTTFAHYDSFQLSNEANFFRLAVGPFIGGNTGDSFSWHNGANFTTKDRDNDISMSNCAEAFKGAWWHFDCHVSSLNGLYLHGSHESYADGIEWYYNYGHRYSLKFTEMKIRRKVSR